MILVTGGAGFIGSHVVTALVGRGERVRVLDNLSTGHLDNLDHVRDDIEWLEGDVADADAVAAAMEGARKVVHLAACASVNKSFDEALAAHQDNATGTLAVLDAARQRQVQRLVFASSSAVYGDTEPGPAAEERTPDPLSPYAAQKLIGEHYAQIYASVHGLPTVCLRYFNVFGPRQDPTSPYSGVISVFATRLLRGDPVTIYGDGEQTRDFTAVDNVVQANLLALDGQVAPGSVCNIATGRSISVNHLYRTMAQMLGVEREPDYADGRPGEIRHSVADLERARTLLGFHPQISFEDGIRFTVDWYAQAEQLGGVSEGGRDR